MRRHTHARFTHVCVYVSVCIYQPGKFEYWLVMKDLRMSIGFLKCDNIKVMFKKSHLVVIHSIYGQYDILDLLQNYLGHTSWRTYKIMTDHGLIIVKQGDRYLGNHYAILPTFVFKLFHEKRFCKWLCQTPHTAPGLYLRQQTNILYVEIIFTQQTYSVGRDFIMKAIIPLIIQTETAWKGKEGVINN